jgi:tetratricopeptide (TPR) repeat protein
MATRTTVSLFAGLLVTLVVPAQGGTLPGTPQSDEALALCMSADRAAGTQKLALLERGLTLAEQAVAADDADAAGHFAVFCNLGRRTRLHPLGFGSLTAVRRLRREIDRALELAPDSTDLLVAKAMFLFELPRFFGGDSAEAERLLLKAVDLEPDRADARFALARVLLANNERDAAAAQIQAALSAGEPQLNPSQVPEARTLRAGVEQ